MVSENLAVGKCAVVCHQAGRDWDWKLIHCILLIYNALLHWQQTSGKAWIEVYTYNLVFTPFFTNRFLPIQDKRVNLEKFSSLFLWVKKGNRHLKLTAHVWLTQTMKVGKCLIFLRINNEKQPMKMLIYNSVFVRKDLNPCLFNSCLYGSRQTNGNKTWWWALIFSVWRNWRKGGKFCLFYKYYTPRFQLSGFACTIWDIFAKTL